MSPPTKADQTLTRPPLAVAGALALWLTVLLGLNHAGGGLLRLLVGAIAALALLVGIFADPVAGRGFMSLGGDGDFRRTKNAQLVIGSVSAYLASFLLGTGICVAVGILVSALVGLQQRARGGAGADGEQHRDGAESSGE